MFEKKKEFPWRIPIVILLGIVVLAGGIYVGFKGKDYFFTKKTNQEQSKEVSTKEIFNLSEDCEIWVEKTLEDGTPSEEAPTMISTIPKELVGKSKDYITSYLSSKYPDKNIKKIDTYEITLQEKESFNDRTKANKFAIIDNKGYLNIYKYDNKGNRIFIEGTEVETSSLPKKVQEEVKTGIYANSEEEIYERLEDFGS